MGLTKKYIGTFEQIKIVKLLTLVMRLVRAS